MLLHRRPTTIGPMDGTISSLVERSPAPERARTRLVMIDGVKAGLPSGTVTFLLTDLEGSTRLWETDPVNAAVVVPRHRDLIGEAIGAHDGGRPLEQGEGDNVVAAFGRSIDAIRAAHAAQVALDAEPWPDGVQVRVRMALHTGEVEVHDDGTYAGPVLNRCARIRALAHGGQILVSSATADLVADNLEDGLALTDLGAHRLRDLSRPERVWQLDGPGLTPEHPPLRSLDATPNNLPVQVSSFIGRDDDIAQGARLMDESRLLTLTGAGGCGKTRLALRVASELTVRFPDGTWWVELAPLTEPELVAETVAAAVGLRPTLDRSALDSLIAHLAEYPSLLVLDNCEHLVEAVASFVDHVLRSCEGSAVLATSRESLAVEGEVTWRVPSMALPPQQPISIEALEQYDAVRLFVDRAVQARPNFRVDNDNAPAIAQICHRLDGIPLAIELAAARTRSLSPERICEGLDDRFRLLAGTRRAAMPRQQTLDASVDWSHELLDAEERTLFRRLGVFAGGFTLDAAEGVAALAPLDRYGVLDVLGRLVEKSLVQADDDAGGTVRYRLLETIRQYACDRLDEAGESTTRTDRHLEWVMDFVAEHEDDVTNAHVDALELVDRDHANIRAALDWAISAPRVDDALRLVAMLGVFWAGRGHYADAIAVVPRVLALAPEGSPLAGRARWAGAYVRFYGDDPLAAIEEAALGLEEATAVGDEMGIARCLHTMGTALFIAEPAQARAMLEQSVELARSVGDEWCEADALQMQAYSYLCQGKVVPAEPLLHESFALARRKDNEFQAAWHVMGLALITASRGDLVKAEELMRDAEERGRRLGDPSVEGFCASQRCEVQLDLGRIDDLRELVARLAAPGTDWGMIGQASVPSRALAVQALDQPAPAGDALAEVAEANAAQGMLNEAAHAWRLAACAALAAGDLAATRARAAKLEELPEFVQERVFGGIAAAIAERLAGEDTAEDTAHAALGLCVEHALLVGVPRALAVLGGLAIDAGASIDAARLLGAADALERGMGRVRLPHEQAWFDADVAATSALLDEASFADAWASGAALSCNEAVEYAQRARGERKRPTFGWESLTPTELRVVDLVADGLTNPAVADKLLMGRETVKTHLAHVFTLLGVGSRSELRARVVERRARPGSGS
jgi:predicted ATPase/class 3 adenylate cyclase/DNA-binding CsgD family transcriptional regulator